MLLKRYYKNVFLQEAFKEINSLFQEHPFQEDFDRENLIKSILDNQQIQEIFEL